MSKERTVGIVQKYMLNRMECIMKAFSTNDQALQEEAAQQMRAVSDIQLLLLQETYEKNLEKTA